MELKLKDSMEEVAALEHAEEIRWQKIKFLISSNNAKNMYKQSTNIEIQQLQRAVENYAKRLRESEEQCDNLRIAFKEQVHFLKHYLEKTRLRHKEKEESLQKEATEARKELSMLKRALSKTQQKRKMEYHSLKEELSETQNQLEKTRNELKSCKRKLVDADRQLIEARKEVILPEKDVSDLSLQPHNEAEALPRSPKPPTSRQRKRNARARKPQVIRAESPDLCEQPPRLEDLEPLSNKEQPSESQTLDNPDILPSHECISPVSSPPVNSSIHVAAPSSPSPPPTVSAEANSSSQPIASPPPTTPSQAAACTKPIASTETTISSESIVTSKPVSSSQPSVPAEPTISSQPVISSRLPVFSPSLLPLASSQPISSSRSTLLVRRGSSSQSVSSSQSRPKRRKLGGKSRAYLFPEEGCLSPLSQLINEPT
ncbi:hypothetical protein EC973_006510 [Apophysomyces ossiformis]|uniref:Uncharacterized protein n=1 Tax=Apophysomyces ossiformis TaxID=679940 RepID=A0A8H7BTA9_9FUNG|nr:hypothetical protein EC973_006510 [Apophysomyces ossiformis]